MEDNNYFGGPNPTPNPDPNSNQNQGSNPDPNQNPNPSPAPNQGGYQPQNGYQGGYQYQNGYQGASNPNGGYGYTAYPQGNPMYVQKPGALEYVSLVLGILSVVVCCSLGPFSIPFGIGAIICALVGKAKSHRFFGIGIAGLILGIAGCLMGIFIVLIILIWLQMLGLTLPEFIRLYQTGELYTYMEQYVSSLETEIEAVITAVRSMLR